MSFLHGTNQRIFSFESFGFLGALRASVPLQSFATLSEHVTINRIEGALDRSEHVIKEDCGILRAG
jgi:hypothetical protein